jgi:hypothetical protein
MITVEATEKEIHVTIPRDEVDAQGLDAMLRWLEFDGITRTSKMTADEAMRLAEDSKAGWWEQNQHRFLPTGTAAS